MFAGLLVMFLYVGIPIIFIYAVFFIDPKSSNFINKLLYNIVKKNENYILLFIVIEYVIAYIINILYPTQNPELYQNKSFIKICMEIYRYIDKLF